MNIHASWEMMKNILVSPEKNNAVSVTPSPILLAPEQIENAVLLLKDCRGNK